VGTLHSRTIERGGSVDLLKTYGGSDALELKFRVTAYSIFGFGADSGRPARPDSHEAFMARSGFRIRAILRSPVHSAGIWHPNEVQVRESRINRLWMTKSSPALRMPVYS